MCNSCVEKDVFSKTPVLRPGSYCLRMKSQDIFKENKLSGEIASQLTYFPDVVQKKEAARVLQIGFFLSTKRWQI